MTCIVAIKDEKTGDVVLAGDALTSSWAINHSAAPKVFERDGIGFGCCGRLREANLIRYSVCIPMRGVGQDAFEFMVCSLVPAIKSAMAGAASQDVINGRAEVDSEWIVVVEGRLFKIGCDYAVCEFEDRYIATGSGGEYALGALHALEGKHGTGTDEEKAKAAIAAADRFCSSVGGKVTIVRLKGKAK